MRKALVITILSVMAVAAFGSAQSVVATDARPASGGLPPVYDQMIQPLCPGGGPPGADEIVYDDGQLAKAYYVFTKTLRYAMRMDPAYHPAIIAQCDIHVLTNGDPYWPWPESHHDSICVEIWFDSNGDRNPDVREIWSQWARATGADTATITVRPPLGSIICRTGSFWVGMMEDTLAGSGYEGVGIDSALNHPGHFYAYDPPDTCWGQNDYNPGDVMFRSWTMRQGVLGIVAEITAPPETVSLGDTVIPSAHIVNLGNGADSSWVWMRIQDTSATDNYVDSCWVRLDTLEMLDTTYRAWSPLYPGIYRMQCTTERNDTNWTYFTVLPRTGLEQGRMPLSLARNRIEVGPNPIRTAAVIRYSVTDKSRVKLRILDARGMVVRTLVAGSSSPGEHLAVWDARDDQGRSAARGIYFVLLESQDCRETRKVVLTR